MERELNIAKWIKKHWFGSLISAVAGVSVPVLDAFIDIWSILGKIRPLDGFPYWLIALLVCICILAILSLIISNKYKKPSFLIKKNIREWVKYAILAILALLAGVIMSAVNTSIKNKNNRDKFEKYVALEMKYLSDGTHGLKEFYEGDYGVAYDSLRLYCNTDPVSAYYYGVIIFDGLCKNIEQHETTNAIRLIDSAAQCQYYRALFRMEDYYYRQNMQKEAMLYAEQFLKVSSLRRPPQFDFPDTITQLFSTLWSNYLMISFDRLQSYYIFEEHDRRSAKDINNLYYSCFKDLAHKYKNLFDILHKEKDIIVDWQLGYKKTAERNAKKLVKKYPGEIRPARLYAEILVCGERNVNDVDVKKLQKAEKVLIEALSCTINNDQAISSTQQNEYEMYKTALLLSDIYDSTGYWIESAEMEHFASAFELINKYRAYESASK